MNPNTAIHIRNLSKQYRLGQVGTGTLSHDLKRWWTTNVLGKEDPYLKIGEVNDRAHKGHSDYVWALKDINLEIAQGDVVGIIGKNGAGKSTLLKLLSRVTKPSTGTIQYRGRIASLLEVGTGFHPEMTGRENIYMNGAIMGMTRHEITRKLDEIIAFAGVERYIDTPVKRYSSGMTVRLGFAVAAHLEPDILVVDEVLAVGDAEFQKKAIGKMQDVSQQGGRTVLFVSHNMAAVQNMCGKCIVLKEGTYAFEGFAEQAIEYYLKDCTLFSSQLNTNGRKGNGILQVKELKVYGKKYDNQPYAGGSINFDFEIENKGKVNTKNLRLDFRIDDAMGQRLLWISTSMINISPSKNVNIVRFKLDRLILNEGLYYITYQLLFDNQISDWVQNAFSFFVAKGDYYGSGRSVHPEQSKVLADYTVSYH